MLSFRATCLSVLVGGACFYLCHLHAALFVVSIGYLWAVRSLAFSASARTAWYAGMALGLLVFVPHLRFFYGIFGLAAWVLWSVLALWIAAFGSLAWYTRRALPPKLFALILPLLWMATEYARSELYYLRFSWDGVGYAWHEVPIALAAFGHYGLPAVILLLIGLPRALCRPQAKATVIALVLLALPAAATDGPYVAGIQLEFPEPSDITPALDLTLTNHPEANIVVLPEYTTKNGVPERLRAWCRQNQRYLVLGSTNPAGPEQYYNTAYVIDPAGEIVHKQAKSVPIQFFRDGLPAETQAVWQSPWGPIGICICYDLSYTRVVDELVRQGAKALIVPTMDVAEWGAYQHTVHAKVAPTRAAEYRIPIFRLASSGISQLVDAHGNVLATAPFPGPRATIGGHLAMSANARLPWDRRLARITLGALPVLLLILIIHTRRRTSQQHAKNPTSRERAT